MGFRDFDQAEIEATLARERVVRIAFSGAGEQYLVPVFFAWHEGALWGLTTPGRKTQLAKANPAVAFQVDSSATTGPWEWSSVTGEGTFEFIEDPAAVGAFAPLLQARLADAPEWAQKALFERFARLGRVPFRITPTALFGRAHEQE
ncbi:hypothetical protein AYO38_11280 [bacterium SCGC AG-212-C10]|nr:hypothetical protein AYO38_11280 [bacterium SCGC AG-212-C10]